MVLFNDWSPPACPACNKYEMEHKLSTVPIKTGWWCLACKSGPYKLKGISEQDAAHFAIKLINDQKTVGK